MVWYISIGLCVSVWVSLSVMRTWLTRTTLLWTSIVIRDGHYLRKKEKKRWQVLIRVAETREIVLSFYLNLHTLVLSEFVFFSSYHFVHVLSLAHKLSVFAMSCVFFCYIKIQKAFEPPYALYSIFFMYNDFFVFLLIIIATMSQLQRLLMITWLNLRTFYFDFVDLQNQRQKDVKVTAWPLDAVLYRRRGTAWWSLSPHRWVFRVFRAARASPASRSGAPRHGYRARGAWLRLARSGCSRGTRCRFGGQRAPGWEPQVPSREYFQKVR